MADTGEKPEQEAPFPLLTLPDLVLQNILTHLTTKERKATRATCKKLCKVASAAVRYFHVGSVREESYLDYLQLHQKFPNVQVVSLSDELVASDRPFASLVTLSLCKLKNLCCLLLLNKTMALSAAGLAALTQCKHVKQLVLAPPFVSKGPLQAANNQAMTSIISQLASLTHLLLLPSQHMDPAAATAVGGGPPTQQHGRMEWLREWQLSEAALRHLDCLHGLVQLEVGCEPGLTELSSLVGLSNLRHLALRGLGLEAGDKLNVLPGLPALCSLSLADGGMSEDSLTHVGRCTKLTRLELQGCYRLREQALSHLVPLHKLAHLKCSLSLTECGLHLLVAAAGPRLKLLQADCIEVTASDTHAAAPVGAAAAAAGAAHMPAYVPLGGPLGAAVAAAHAAGVGLGPGAGGLSSAGSGGFGQLGPQFPALQVLQLRRLSSSIPHLWQLAPHLTSLVVWGEANNTGLTRAFTGHCSLRRLALSLEYISDAGLAAVSMLGQLQDLTLCDARSITPQRLIGVIRRLPRLTALQLSHMKHLGDDGLAALVTSARQLRALGLQEPGRLTEQGFALLAGLPRLQSLWVDCCKLTAPVLMALACSTSLALLEVHRSHPEAPGLGPHQLQLLARVRGPRLEVVLRDGARPRDELMRPQGGLLGRGSSARLGSVQQGWGAGGEGLLAVGGGGGTGGGTELALDPAELRLLGSGVLLGGQQLGGGADGGDGGDAMDGEWMAGQQQQQQQADGWLPDLGGLHL